MAERDLYAILEVPRTASEEEIKKAYRRLARELHPDRNPGDKRAEDRFKDISYAREILTNREKRKLYDEFGEMGLREGFDANAYRQYRAWQRGSGGRRVSLDDLFGEGGGQAGWRGGLEDLFGREMFDNIFGGRRRGEQAGQDLVSEISLELVEALRGTEKEIAYQVPSGGSRTIRVRVPPGAKDGGRLRLKGQGVAGGDLVLNLRVRPHPWLRMEGRDLHMELPVSVGEAYRGSKVKIPTLEGPVSLSLPAGVASGTKLRLRGKGVPSRGKHAAGDLIVHVQIRLPEPGSTEVDALIEKLERSYGDVDLRKDMVL